jgi:hypothetical protein
MRGEAQFHCGTPQRLTTLFLMASLMVSKQPQNSVQPKTIFIFVPGPSHAPETRPFFV